MGLKSARTPALDEEIVALGKRIEHWRERKPARNSRMPEELWKAAVSLAEIRGIKPIVKALGLDRFALRRRLGKSGQTGSAAAHSPAFLELLPQPPRPICNIEAFAADGSRLKISVPADQISDLLGVMDHFWSRR